MLIFFAYSIGVCNSFLFCVLWIPLQQPRKFQNEVRLIDLFVGSLSSADFDFKTAFIENGRHAYHLADLLRLFIYSCLNRIHSSR